MKTVVFIKVSVLSCLTLLLASCGGGSSSSTPAITEPATQTFQVNVESITVTRLTNGENVEVDTSALTSGELDYTP